MVDSRFYSADVNRWGLVSVLACNLVWSLRAILTKRSIRQVCVCVLTHTRAHTHTQHTNMSIYIYMVCAYVSLHFFWWLDSPLL